MNKKNYFSKEEIDNFKKYMRINRSLPREHFLKTIDFWKRKCQRQEYLLTNACEIFLSVVKEIRDEFDK